MGGSSKKVTSGYKYYLGVHFVLCQGPIESVLEIEVDEKNIFDSSATDETLTIDKPNLFGGEDREGGIVGSIDIALGNSTQSANSYLQNKIGTSIPAYRGVVSAILRQVYVGLNPYLKPWAFKAKRIRSTGINGDTQWNEGYAAITQNAIPMDLGTRAYAAAFGVDTDGTQVRKLSYVSESTTEFTVKREIYDPDGTLLSSSNFQIPKMDNYNNTDMFLCMGSAEVTTQRKNGSGSGNVSSLYIDADLSFRPLTSTYNGLNYYSVQATTSSFYPHRMKVGNKYLVHGGNLSSYLNMYYIDGSGSNPQATYLVSSSSNNALYFSVDESSSRVLLFDRTTRTVRLLDSDDLSLIASYDNTKHNWTSSFSGVAYYKGAILTYDFIDAAWGLRLYRIVGGELVQFGDTISASSVSSSRYIVPFSEGKFLSQGRLYSLEPGVEDMNPAHIIRECLTDPTWGLGYTSADIDDDSFSSVAATLFDEGMGISILWTNESPIEDFISEIVRHIDAALFITKSDGKFKLKLIREDEVASPTVFIGEDDVASVTNYYKKSFGELVNSVTVNYEDTEINETRSVTVQDVALIQMQGQVISTTIQYPGFTNKSIATRVAQRDLRSLSSQLRSCTIECTRIAASLEIGDTFVFTWPDLGFSSTVMRVQGLEFGDGRSNRIRIKALEDVFSLPATSIIESPDIYDPNLGGTAIDAAPRLLIEAPYYELAQRLGQTAVDETLSSSPEAGYIIAAAGRSAGAINSRLYVDSGAGYEDSGNLEFSPFGYLAADVLPSETTIVIQNTQDVDLVETATHLQVNEELMVINSITENSSGYEVGVGRGILDTVPAPMHSTGDAVIFWDVYGETDEVEYAAIETIFAKILTNTGNDQLLLADATAESITLDYRAIRPYPPGNVKVNGTAYPSYIGETAELQITWSHRDRLQQTSGELYDTTYGNIGPEAGVTYTLRIYGEDDTLLRTETGITGTSYTYLEDDELSDSKLSSDSNTSYPGDSDTNYRLNYSLRFELEAVRVGVTSDDLTSFQFHNITIVRGSS